MMIPTVYMDIIWVVCIILGGSLLGVMTIIFSIGYIHRISDQLTPNIDEDKEILRGNRAVADYFGRVVAATILGISLVVAAAVLAGILAVLHV